MASVDWRRAASPARRMARRQQGEWRRRRVRSSRRGVVGGGSGGGELGLGFDGEELGRADAHRVELGPDLREVDRAHHDMASGGSLARNSGAMIGMAGAGDEGAGAPGVDVDGVGDLARPAPSVVRNATALEPPPHSTIRWPCRRRWLEPAAPARAVGARRRRRTPRPWARARRPAARWRARGLVAGAGPGRDQQ